MRSLLALLESGGATAPAVDATVLPQIVDGLLSAANPGPVVMSVMKGAVAPAVVGAIGTRHAE
jgi:hypothetical protein